MLDHDVMQVCRNGHVVTDLLHANPTSALPHCDRCGAPTIDRCPTCGLELPGAVAVPGIQPVGTRRPAPFCSACGAPFPWADRPAVTQAPLLALETLLQRLPRVVRQLRTRTGDRPPFRIVDERDLEDLLRSLLPLLFDDIRPESRTPRYSAVTRTDFILAPERIAVTAKYARTDRREPQLAAQLHEDAAYYRAQGNCDVLIAYVHDPEGVLREPRMLNAEPGDDLAVRCVVGALTDTPT